LQEPEYPEAQVPEELPEETPVSEQLLVVWVVQGVAVWLAVHVGLAAPLLVPEQVQEVELPAVGNVVTLAEPLPH